ncbi:MAG: YceI family protein [Bacteroidota bacterium]
MRVTRPYFIPVLFVAVALAGFALPAAPDRPASEPSMYQIDKAHSVIGFKVRHLGITNVTGTFSDYSTRIKLDPGDLRTMEVAARISVESVDTGNARRDDHLRSPDFFEAETYPDIRFQSTEVVSVDGSAFELAGDLTIHGVTQPVVLQGDVIGTAEGPGGNRRIGIEAETTVDRRAFGLEWNGLTEAGGIIVGHDVRIFLELQAVQS